MRRMLFLPMLLAAGCSSNPSAEAPAGASVEWRMDTNRIATAPGKLAKHTATCPSGMVAISGGYSLEKNATPTTTLGSMPLGDKWQVTVRNDSPEPQTLEIVVFVGCVAR